MDLFNRLLTALFTAIFLHCHYVLADVNQDFYSITVTDIYGEQVPLEFYKNKVLLIVNVASECGYTDYHYRELTKLQQQFEKTEHFQVLAFPCNQFGNQEPQEIEAIVKFVKAKYNLNFPLFAKVNVVGDDATPLWKYLQAHAHVETTWNFWKYLVDHEGNVQGAWGPQAGLTDVIPRVAQAVQVAQRMSNKQSERSQQEL